MTPFPRDFRDFPVYFVGIKGTGMAALAELLYRHGAKVNGSDTTEKFYTDEILSRWGIPYIEGFDPSNIPPDTQMVIHSSAYHRKKHPELIEADKRNIPVLEYSEALGAISGMFSSCGITGVHGKTTTTALAGSILKELPLPVSVLAGSGISTFDGNCTLVRGEKYFVAETCEYRRHFLRFHPDRIIVTNIEADHLDYFSGYNDVFSAFLEYTALLPPGGELIYCADDPGASSLAREITRDDLTLIPYGRDAPGEFRISSIEMIPGKISFTLSGWDMEFRLRVPGEHNVLNATAAIALAVILLRKEGLDPDRTLMEKIRKGLAQFSGGNRRSEIIGETGGVLFMDDYGHHPTEISKTLSGLRDFFPDRRLVVDFMSHTYSRTRGLMEEFSKSFKAADEVILHHIYPSAREEDDGAGLDEELFEKVSFHHPKVSYFHEIMDAVPYLEENLKNGDLFITMGAGDNWTLGKKLYESFKERFKDKNRKME